MGISAVNGITLANISAIKGIAKTDTESFLGIDKESLVTIVNWDFNSTTGTGSPSNATLPSGWAVSKNNNWLVHTAEGSTTQTYSHTNSNRAWCFEHGQTGSGVTGPGAGLADGIGASDGSWHVHSNAAGNSAYRYMVFESSNPGGHSSQVRRFMIRTGALDLSSYSSVTMHFWFHMYGAKIGQLGIAATDSATEADSGNQAGTGLGFTADDTGGATITYDSNGDGTLDASGVRITGQQQSSGNAFSATQNSTNKWRKATVNLDNAAGQSSVYIYFLCCTVAHSQYWKSDMAIDNLYLVGS